MAPTMTPSAMGSGSLHSKLVSLSASQIHDLSMDYSEDNESGMYYTYSFHSKTISLPPSAIDCLSIDRYNLDSDDDSDSDQYSFDYESYEYNSEYDFENLDPETTFTGTFRWTDLTKFSDENPELIRRRHSFDQSVSMSRHSISCSSGQRNVTKRRRRKKKEQGTAAKSGATLKNSTSSPNLAVQDETNTLVKNSTSDKDNNNSKSTSTRTNSKSCNTELGERISLLLSSPTNSPRSVTAAFATNPQQQVLARKTLKTGPMKSKGRLAPLKDTPGKVFRDDLSMDDSINTLQDEEEFWCIIKERSTME